MFSSQKGTTGTPPRRPQNPPPPRTRAAQTPSATGATGPGPKLKQPSRYRRAKAAPARRGGTRCHAPPRGGSAAAGPKRAAPPPWHPPPLRHVPAIPGRGRQQKKCMCVGGGRVPKGCRDTGRHPPSLPSSPSPCCCAPSRSFRDAVRRAKRSGRRRALSAPRRRPSPAPGTRRRRRCLAFRGRAGAAQRRAAARAGPRQKAGEGRERDPAWGCPVPRLQQQGGDTASSATASSRAEAGAGQAAGGSWAGYGPAG